MSTSSFVHIHGVKTQHIVWKMRFRSLINRNENVDIEEIKDHRRTELGKWIENSSRGKLIQDNNFKSLIEKNIEFHLLAEEAFIKHQQNDSKLVRDILNRMEKTSEVISGLINELSLVESKN